MSPLVILWLWRLAGGIAMVGGLWLGYEGWAKHERDLGAAPYITAIAAQKTEADRVLAIETAKVEATQKQLTLTLAVQEKTDVLNKQTTDSLGARLRGLATDNSGRLRDPAGCGASGVAAANQIAAHALASAEDAAKASGLLSRELSDLLFQITREADDINNAYASCRADAFAVRAALPSAESLTK